MKGSTVKEYADQAHRKAIEILPALEQFRTLLAAGDDPAAHGFAPSISIGGITEWERDGWLFYQNTRLDPLRPASSATTNDDRGWHTMVIIQDQFEIPELTIMIRQQLADEPDGPRSHG